MLIYSKRYPNIMANNSRPELVFGLVGPLGVDLDSINDSLHRSLERVEATAPKKSQ